MKKILLWLSLVIIFFGILFLIKPIGKSNSEQNSNDLILSLLDDYEKEFNHEFVLATKEIENKLYGKWAVEDDALGYSLKYTITGGQLDDGMIEISKEQYNEIKVRTIDQYKKPVFAYYTETLNEMSTDTMLNYSGIEGIDKETTGIVVIVFGLPTYKNAKNEYELINTKFILVDDYVIAFRTHTFYKLQKIS